MERVEIRAIVFGPKDKSNINFEVERRFGPFKQLFLATRDSVEEANQGLRSYRQFQEFWGVTVICTYKKKVPWKD